MSKVFSAVTITAIAAALMLGLMYYAGSGPVDPKMQVNCRGGEGGQIVAIADDDCAFIAQTLAVEARESKTKTRAPLNASAVALGAAAGPEIVLNPFPQVIRDRIPAISQHMYFVEGNDIAIVEANSRRVVVKIDIQQSSAP